MIIRVIYWEKKTIEEYETDSIKYEDDGISFIYKVSDSFRSFTKISYDQLLGVEL